MNFKIEHKDNFSIVSLLIDEFGVEEFTSLTDFLEENNSLGNNLIVDISNAAADESEGIHQLIALQEGSYKINVSLVICCDNSNLFEDLQTLFPTDAVAITPTLAEAIDIVGMEILERELMNDED